MIEMLQIPFMQMALISGLIISVTCSFLGVYVISRRIVFVGIALTQTATLGVAFAFLFQLNSVVYGTIFTLVASILFALRPAASSYARIPEEGTIGTAYASASAGGLLLIALSPKGEGHVLNLLMGDITATTPDDITLLLSVFTPLALFYFLFRKEILFTSFDPEMASTLNVTPLFWNFLFYLTLGLVIAIAIRIAGPLLTFSLLVVPPIAALMLTKQLIPAFLISIGVATFSTFVGLYLSFIFEKIPSVPAIVAVAFILLVIIGAIFNKTVRILFATGCMGLIVYLSLLQSGYFERQATLEQQGFVVDIQEHYRILYSKVNLSYIGAGTYNQIITNAQHLTDSSEALYQMVEDSSLKTILQSLNEQAKILSKAATDQDIERTKTIGIKVIKQVELLKEHPEILPFFSSSLLLKNQNYKNFT